MESTGLPGKIHVSRKTAQQLGREDKGHWVTEREELVAAKGKGFLNTFWAEPQHFESADRALDAMPSSQFLTKSPEDELRRRLIDWNVALLAEMLTHVVAHHHNTRKSNGNNFPTMTDFLPLADFLPRTSDQSVGSVDSEHDTATAGGKSIRDEVLDTIPLPTYKAQKEKRWGRIRGEEVDLGPAVVDQLRVLVTAIAARYPPNAFHNYEHASHVMMSAKKLLQRVTGSGPLEDEGIKEDTHYQSYGIGSDPLTQFAIVFSGKKTLC